ncbi:hypothetical protein AMATHDRAFT_42785 [Amanita thiersii Skay4041]|uniref:Uncharacterized protein n=1 Tax=Amanita thiersii Skay4041 TaxID=703135 RepID=A0A2A9NIS0_9AGAR|nr:hypothetical protein AMATHDRAFT_42785 [Amanita thiersii Skay4041]
MPNMDNLNNSTDKTVDEFTDLLIGGGVSRVYHFSLGLTTFYMAPANLHIRTDRWRVIELKLYKVHTNMQHEYLVATLEGPDQANVLLKIERTSRNPRLQSDSQGNAHHASNVQQVSESVISHRSALFQLVCDMVGSVINKTAHDLVSIVTEQKEHELVEHLRFANRYPDLLELAMLATATQSLATEYNLLDRNCYWFVWASTGYFMQEYQDAVVPVNLPMVVSMPSGSEVRRLVRGICYIFDGSEQYQSFSIQELVDAYRKCRGKFDSAVNTVKSNLEAKEKYEAEQRAHNHTIEQLKHEREAHIATAQQLETVEAEVKHLRALFMANASIQLDCVLFIIMHLTVLHILL